MVNYASAQSDQVAVLTEAEASEKAKAYYDNKGEWAGKFTLSQVHRVRFELQGDHQVVAHIQYQAAFLLDTSKTIEDQRTFNFIYQAGQWQVSSMGGHKSATF